MGTIGSIISTVLGLIGGGWGSAVAAIALIGALLYVKHLWTKFQEEKAVNDGKTQAAKDQQNAIDKNTQQGQTVVGDEAKAEKDKADAIKNLGGNNGL